MGGALVTNGAVGDASHREGIDTVSFGEASHAEGKEGQSLGENSHVEGFKCHAEGPSSHAEGISNSSFGDGAHVEGKHNGANGDYSHAEGYGTMAMNPASHTAGKYNIGTSADTIHETGIGTANNNRANAFEIHIDGKIVMPNLPTTDPVLGGALWNDSGILKISAG